MKRHGGGGRGVAKARGVLRDDKGGGNATGDATGGPAKGNASAGPGGGNDTGGPTGENAPEGPAGGNDTGGPAGGNDTGNQPNKSRKGYGAKRPRLKADEKKEEWGPTQIDKLLPAAASTQSCNFIFRTEKTSGTAIIVFKSSGNLLCMGSIVDHKHILTAKACVNMAAARHLLVIVGCAKPWWGRRSQVKGVKKILNHEYLAALLRLKSRIVYTKFVQPARLPSSATKKTKLTWLYEEPYYVMGFPVDKHGVPGEKVPKDIFYGLQGDSYFELEFCEKIHKSFSLDPKRVFCTLGNSTYCWGAWGAPVLVDMNSYFLQVGVVTNDACTSVKAGPYVVFRTDAYADWIRGHLRELHQPT